MASQYAKICLKCTLCTVDIKHGRSQRKDGSYKEIPTANLHKTCSVWVYSLFVVVCFAVLQSPTSIYVECRGQHMEG